MHDSSQIKHSDDAIAIDGFDENMLIIDQCHVKSMKDFINEKEGIIVIRWNSICKIISIIADELNKGEALFPASHNVFNKVRHPT